MFEFQAMRSAGLKAVRAADGRHPGPRAVQIMVRGMKAMGAQVVGQNSFTLHIDALPVGLPVSPVWF
ncbi:hypothetical protein PSE10B_15280 [Pseudomonas amygdali pv. eriobotryae]|uniref:Uncharacterized protein n=1 Tax=Pseudomonas amygdali pv. eriobotryae TaxID=129137 RepID=A0A9P3EA26_PSEA0|nr:hypothetical protein PSE10A_04940 [Pseudomonas amygdali pv. eriobotryae]GFZ65006.1 hypothetical protein PSE10B_15280 [Pseudomonas amygdali pv. eriobotryae]GFZ69795.1 hypothetical protein PSE10C_05370 [Pseudomonas amygdali pv. eriobotryae]